MSECRACCLSDVNSAERKRRKRGRPSDGFLRCGHRDSQLLLLGGPPVGIPFGRVVACIHHSTASPPTGLARTPLLAAQPRNHIGSAATCRLLRSSSSCPALDSERKRPSRTNHRRRPLRLHPRRRTLPSSACGRNQVNGIRETEACEGSPSETPFTPHAPASPSLAFASHKTDHSDREGALALTRATSGNSLWESKILLL